jgi:hypothetical protein
MIQLRMNYTSGASFTGDCAIDNLRFMEMPLAGCMDPFADNYDPSATIDDGSCLYTGCMDPGAINYDAGANADCAGVSGGTDMSCCTYPQANALDFCDDLESGSGATNGWLFTAGSQAGCFSGLLCHQ